MEADRNWASLTNPDFLKIKIRSPEDSLKLEKVAVCLRFTQVWIVALFLQIMQ